MPLRSEVRNPYLLAEERESHPMRELREGREEVGGGSMHPLTELAKHLKRASALWEAYRFAARSRTRFTHVPSASPALRAASLYEALRASERRISSLSCSASGEGGLPMRFLGVMGVDYGPYRKSLQSPLDGYILSVQ